MVKKHQKIAGKKKEKEKTETFKSFFELLTVFRHGWNLLRNFKSRHCCPFEFLFQSETSLFLCLENGMALPSFKDPLRSSLDRDLPFLAMGNFVFRHVALYRVIYSFSFFLCMAYRLVRVSAGWKVFRYYTIYHDPSKVAWHNSWPPRQTSDSHSYLTRRIAIAVNVL